MSANRKIAVFILTNGRSDNVITYKTLRAVGYTGKIYLIVDDEDNRLQEYKDKYKDEVIVFSKKDYAHKFDIMDNFTGSKVIVYARNACNDIARKLGLDYFFEYEDDYSRFTYRKYVDGSLKTIRIKDFDPVLNVLIDALNNTKACSIAFTQAGEMQGGVLAIGHVHLKRKAMNSFVFKVNKDKSDDLIFIGRMNDDINTYLTQGKVGKLFFQVANVMLDQGLTQQVAGGNTEAYLKSGTYVKSFYSVMAEPSCVKIGSHGRTNARVHSSVKWKMAVPKILDEKHKKL